MDAASSSKQVGNEVSATDWQDHHDEQDRASQRRSSLNQSISSRHSSVQPSTDGASVRATRQPYYRQPSVRIRRLPSQQQHVQFASQSRLNGRDAGAPGTVTDANVPGGGLGATGRRRSSSDPRPAPGYTPATHPHGALTRSATGMSGLATLAEEGGQAAPSTTAGPAAPLARRPGAFRRASDATKSALGFRQPSQYGGSQAGSTAGSDSGQNQDEYDEDLVNILDVVGTMILVSQKLLRSIWVAA